MGQKFCWAFILQLPWRVYGFSDDYPIYVINLAHHSERREYMEMTFYSHKLHFVSSLNGHNSAELFESLEDISDLGALQQEKDKYTKRKTGASRGQLGNTISLLRAMEQALNDGADYAVIVEDDVSDSNKYLWPAPLSAYVNYADRKYPHWHNIRLEWGMDRTIVNMLKRKWYQVIRDNVSEPLAIGRRYGNLTGDEDFPLVMPFHNGWGTVATLWSKEGMEFMVERMRSDQWIALRNSSQDNTEATDITIKPWKCPELLNCISDNFFWRVAPENSTLVTTPPLIGCRLSESSTTEIRGPSKTHQLTHLSITATNVHWLIETFEFLHPRPTGTWPTQSQYSVGPASWSR